MSRRSKLGLDPIVSRSTSTSVSYFPLTNPGAIHSTLWWRDPSQKPSTVSRYQVNHPVDGQQALVLRRPWQRSLVVHPSQVFLSRPDPFPLLNIPTDSSDFSFIFTIPASQTLSLSTSRQTALSLLTISTGELLLSSGTRSIIQPLHTSLQSKVKFSPPIRLRWSPLLKPSNSLRLIVLAVQFTFTATALVPSSTSPCPTCSHPLLTTNFVFFPHFQEPVKSLRLTWSTYHVTRRSDRMKQSTHSATEWRLGSYQNS